MALLGMELHSDDVVDLDRGHELVAVSGDGEHIGRAVAREGDGVHEVDAITGRQRRSVARGLQNSRRRPAHVRDAEQLVAVAARESPDVGVEPP